MLNKFHRARLMACEKRIRTATETASRYEINENRFKALVDGKCAYSVGMRTFKKALQDCVVVRLFHVY